MTVKAVILRYKALHLGLLAELVLLAAFFALRPVRPAMEALSRVMGAVRLAIGELSYMTDLSMLEVLTGGLVAAVALYLVWSVIAVARAKRKGERLYTALLGAAAGALAVVVSFCYLWGPNFYIDGFQERSGIYEEKVSVEDLHRVTAYFVERLQETADRVPRDANGLFSVPRAEILEKSPGVYDWVEGEFPFLQLEDKPPKALRFSRIMSRLDFTGMYCPYAGESSVNMDSPACMLPSTVAHELAHQRGLTSEQECNFLGVLASVTSGEPAYDYSGWLMGYVHLGNALYAADYELWEPIYYALPETVRADLTNNNAYWRQFEDTAVREISNQAYDSFLKSYGQEEGLKSYGTVVDLLVVYYRDKIF